MSQDSMNRVDPVAASETLDLTRRLLQQHSDRVAGTSQCLKAAGSIASLLRKHCDRVDEEHFKFHPESFWNLGRIISVSYCISALCFLAGGSLAYVSLLVSLLGLYYGVTLYIFFGSSLDFLFPRAEGCNVAGVINPSGQVTQQVYLVAHHDSPYVFTFLLGWQMLAGTRILLTIVAYVFLCVAAFAASTSALLDIPDLIPRTISITGLGIGLIFTIPVFFLITRRPSPGAGDNLNSCAMVIKTAEHFANEKRNGRPLTGTRLVFLTTDGEEVGQRGATAYAERHKTDLLNLPTVVLNLESVFKLQDLAILTRDTNCMLPLSKSMVKECRGIAAQLGYSLRGISLPVGGGGTDAASFARVGVEATSIIGIATALFNTGLVYHTPFDTPEHIEPDAVEAVLNIAINYIEQKDGDPTRSSSGHEHSA
jgi:hypothetical protein